MAICLHFRDIQIIRVDTGLSHYRKYFTTLRLSASARLNWFQVVQTNNWSCITSPPTYPDVNGDVDVTKTMPTQ